MTGSAPRYLTADALARLPDDGWRHALRRGVLLRRPGACRLMPPVVATPAAAR